MKIMIVSESISTPSGFGMQTLMLSEGLVERGHEVCVVSNTAQPRKNNPEGLSEWVVPAIDNKAVVDRTIHQYAPDAVIIFWYTHMVAHMAGLKSAPANCPTFFWFPWEGSTVPPEGGQLFFNLPKNRVAHLSNFASELWSDVINSDVVIPHGVDSSIFRPLTLDVKELRRKWAMKVKYPFFDDALVVLCIERNIAHKRWDATFDYVRKLQKATGKTVQLIAHTKKVQVSGPNQLPGYDLPKLEKLYGIENQVAYTDFDWDGGFSREEVNELYALCDIRVSTSEGEGFGIGTVEAAFAKCLQVVNKHTTMPELLGEFSTSLVEPAFTEMSRNTLWQAPNVTAMVDRTVELLANPDTGYQIQEAYEHALEHFEKSKVLDQWEKLLLESREDFTWYTHRWGFNAAIHTLMSWKNLVDFLNKFVPGGSLVEVGSFDGKFLDLAAQTNLKISGVESDSRALDQCTLRSRGKIVQVDSLLDPWPQADVLVWTDMLERFFDAGGVSAVEDALSRIANYEWAFIRLEPAYRWDWKEFDVGIAVQFLESHGMTRRFDIEKVAKEQWSKELTHQIWQVGSDTSKIPVGILKSSGG